MREVRTRQRRTWTAHNGKVDSFREKVQQVGKKTRPTRKAQVKVVNKENHCATESHAHMKISVEQAQLLVFQEE